MCERERESKKEKMGHRHIDEQQTERGRGRQDQSPCGRKIDTKSRRMREKETDRHRNRCETERGDGKKGNRERDTERENLDKIFIERKGESDGNRKKEGGGRKIRAERRGRDRQFKRERS